MLSQSEIDALLGAVSATEESPEGEKPSNLSAAGRAVKTYDFRRPDKFSKDQLRTLQAMHENVARIAGARLSARLRTPVTISLADTAQMIFDEFISGLVLPTQLVVLHDDNLGGPFLLDLDLGLAYGWIDRILGGIGRIPNERREPTSIETALIERLVDEFIPALVEGWAHLQRIAPTVTETALGPALLRVAAPSHVVAVLTYEVRFAGQTAPLTLTFPHDTLALILPRLSATAWYSQPDRGGAEGASRGQLAAALQGVEIPVTAVLGGVELSVEALMDLKPGDVIKFGGRVDDPIRLSVMDQARAWAIPGRVGERLGLRLVSALQPVEA